MAQKNIWQGVVDYLAQPDNRYSLILKGIAAGLLTYSLYTRYSPNKSSGLTISTEKGIDVSLLKSPEEDLKLVISELIKMGNEKFEDNDYDGALEHFLEAVNLKCIDPDVFYKLNLCEVHRDERMLNPLEKDLVAEGSQALKLNEIDRAITCFQDAVTLKPNNASNYLKLAVCYNKVGSYKKAQEQLTKAVTIDKELKKDPQYIDALKNAENK
ncbi:DnaJ [Acrasis kona]|uniref:DnaJ n=1 Tax=Acrasis kona TaxID=1008807 RepID=A0AAW2Z0R8_9EUKA